MRGKSLEFGWKFVEMNEWKDEWTSFSKTQKITVSRTTIKLKERAGKVGKVGKVGRGE